MYDQGLIDQWRAGSRRYPPRVKTATTHCYAGAGSTEPESSQAEVRGRTEETDLRAEATQPGKSGNGYEDQIKCPD